MKSILKICLTFLAITSFWNASAQTKKKFSEWNKPQIVVVDYENSQTLTTIETDEKGYISVKKIPDKVIITLPDKNPEKILVKITDVKKSTFSIGFAPDSSKGYQQLQLSDISNNSVTLYFHRDELVQIGNRRLTTPLSVVTPFVAQIGIITEPAKPVSPAIKIFPETGAKQLAIPFAENDIIRSVENCFLCQPFFVDCESMHRSPLLPTQTFKHLFSPIPKPQPDGKGNIDNAWNRSIFGKRNNEHYKAFYRDSSRWFASNIGDNFYPVSKPSTIHPHPGDLITVNLIAVDTAKISISIDGESYFFKDGESAINNLTADVEKAAVHPGGDATNNSTLKLLISEIKSERIDSLKFHIQLLDSLKPKNYLDTIEREQELIDNIKAEQQIIASMNEEDIKKLVASEWKAKLIALDRLLEYFNFRFPNNTFLNIEKNLALIQIQLAIKNCLHITINGTDSSSLRKSLTYAISTQVDSSYWKELELDIQNVAMEYEKAVSRKTNLKLFTREIQVPDEDEITLKITDLDKEKALMPTMTFNTRGGFKIDFSSGIFFTTLKNPEFVLTKSVFQYRETKDTVVVMPGGIPKDSVMYSGKVNNVSGNFIRENKNRLNYGAGIFFHGYRRSGHAFNWGVTAGGILNNTGQGYIALGLSGMLKSKIGRIAVVGGLVGGQEKKLSVSGESYKYKPEYEAFENGQKLYDNSRQLPRFFDNASNELPTYTYWKIGWFVGVTFNFATISNKK